jgi:hypothetical protein
MRWRNRYLWVFGALVALAVIAFSGHPNAAVGAADAAFAPLAPSPTIEAAPSAQLLLSHLSWCGHALQSTDLPLALQAFHSGKEAHRVAGIVRPYYGPLYRRPPPSFS